MFGLDLLAKLFKVLRSGDTPGQIAAGFILGMVIGLTPVFSLHNLIIVFLIIIFNVNISMAIFAFLLFSGFAWILDPVFHSFGYFLLVDITSLRDLYTTLYNIPIIALSKFNNTVVLGSLISSILIMPVIYFLTKNFVVVYRTRLEPKVNKLKVVQSLKASKVYGFYEKVRDWRD
ncbi:MAG: hypothetical protein SCALA702_34230 [Melioribacteraceae bacterium]|nr:MAG: hypothetical protein SCALA702_34230 [Melioribacteraceae bacterium]